jgi:NAD(P)-dependent dehydrogenase (short-subunit alcohol dehydrogenase family)
MGPASDRLTTGFRSERGKHAVSESGVQRTWEPPDLRGAVAVVTGASRGGGRGIALALGECGATVYVTGRSVRGGPTTDGLPGTVDDAAEEVTARGGRGVAVRVDHAVDAEVEALFERVGREQGRLDLLVNNAWGGYEGQDRTWNRPFWEQPLWRWDRMLGVGLRSHLVASHVAVRRLFLAQGRGLIVHTTVAMAPGYGGALFYDVVKTAINRMTVGMAHELRQYGVAVLALAPGWMRTEAVMADKPPHARPQPEQLHRTHSPEYAGRAVAALAADPAVIDRSGQLLPTAEVGRAYGFADVDGRRVPVFEPGRG